MAEVEADIPTQFDHKLKDENFINQLYIPLNENEPCIKQAMFNCFTYFTIEVQDTSKLLTIR